MPKKSTIATHRRTFHWSRAALAAALIAGGGAQAQFIDPLQNDPLLTPQASLPPLNDGTLPVGAAVPVDPATGSVTIGARFLIEAPTLDALAIAFLGVSGMPLQLLQPGITGSTTANVSIPLNNFNANVTFNVALAATPTAPSCSMEQVDATGGVLATVGCTYNPTAAAITFDPLTTETMDTGEIWRLQIGYTVADPEQRHTFEMAFGGTLNLRVPYPGGASNYLNTTTINFPSAAGQQLTFLDQTGAVFAVAAPLTNPLILGALARMPDTLGPVANHQPVLIATNNSASSVSPAGGTSNVSVTFQNQGTAASLAAPGLSYSATGLPPNAAMSNCTYTITPQGGAPVTANATACSVNAAGNLTFGIAANTALPSGATIQINYTVAVPASTAATAAGYSFTHTLNGSAGTRPAIAAVVGVLAGGGGVVSPMAYATGGTQSVPAIGPLALGGMGLMVALVPGFVARRRRAAARAAQ